MAGGGGTRLWPLSRAGFPKQFLALGGSETLFQAAVSRFTGISGADVELAPPIEQLCEVGADAAAKLLLEPVGRNTAPAMTLAALQAAESGRETVLVVVPADQTVTDNAAFGKAITEAVRVAAGGAVCVACCVCGGWAETTSSPLNSVAMIARII